LLSQIKSRHQMYSLSSPPCILLQGNFRDHLCFHLKPWPLQ
jgi:hypothetical protein